MLAFLRLILKISVIGEYGVRIGQRKIEMKFAADASEQAARKALTLRRGNAMI